MMILVAGDRYWTDVGAIRRELMYIKQFEPSSVIVHGKCHLGGADIIAGDVANFIGLGVIEEPADWYAYGKRAGPLRNQLMIDRYHPEFALLFHANIERSKGTKDMRNRLIAAQISYKLVSK